MGGASFLTDRYIKRSRALRIGMHEVGSHPLHAAMIAAALGVFYGVAGGGFYEFLKQRKIANLAALPK